VTDDVFAAVRELVDAGEYRDQLPGVPGTSVHGAAVLRHAVHGGGWRRMYDRGSPEHVAARAAGLVERLPRPVRASVDAVEECEAVLGRRLPALLRRLYLEVGNGGFGPGYGILGVRDGHRDDTGRTSVDLYRAWRGTWPQRTGTRLAVCHWGCAIYSLVDCADPDGQMWAVDPNPAPDNEADAWLFPQDMTFAEWLRRWADRTLYQPALVQDSDTGQWRGATDEEMRGWAAEVDGWVGE
jgi:hypothetical protein